MMNQTGPVLLGQYRPLDSFLHRLDARAKLLPVLLVLVLALMTASMLFYALILFTLIVSLLAAGVGVKAMLRNFQPMLLLVLITSLYHLVFSGQGTEIQFTVFGWGLRSGALQSAAFYSLRLILFISIAFLITLTNSPSELAEAFTKLLRPLRYFKVPVNDLGLIVFTAIRFIPILYEEFLAIRNAQTIRGVDFTGNFVTRIKRSTFLLIPVFVAAIGRADELAVAIEARGYDSQRERTVYTHSRLDRAAWIFMAVVSLGIVVLFVLTRKVKA
jgi:energy-coupling factor transport system permease protein